MDENSEKKIDALEILKVLIIRDGLSVSAAIRKYTAMLGLPRIPKSPTEQEKHDPRD